MGNHDEGWRSMGRHAARHNTPLKTLLTNNPTYDALIKEGYEEGVAAKAKPKSAPTDLFGNPLKASKPWHR